MSAYVIDPAEATRTASRALATLRVAASEAHDNRQDALCAALNLAAWKVQEAIEKHGRA